MKKTNWFWLLIGNLLMLLLAVGWLIFHTMQPTLLENIDQAPTPDVAVAQLKTDVETLAVNYTQRHANNPYVLNQAAAFIEQAFKATGAQTSRQSYTVDDISGANENTAQHPQYHNIIAHFGGDGAPIIIGAHYDAHANTPGADDNASGVAGLLALARMFKAQPPSIPVTLVAYTLEEPPYFRTEHMGSRHHAQWLVAQGIQPRMVMVLEMIGYFDNKDNTQHYPIAGLNWLYPNRGNFIAVIGRFGDTALVNQVKNGMQLTTSLPVYSINAPEIIQGIDFSDHAAYWRHDIPAVMITDTAFYRNAHYHQATDTPDTLNYTAMAEVIKGVYGVVMAAENQPVSQPNRSPALSGE